MRELLRIGAMMHIASRSARRLSGLSCGQLFEAVDFKLPGPSLQMFNTITVSRLLSQRGYSNNPPHGENNDSQLDTIRIKVDEEEYKFAAGSIVKQVLANLSKRHGGGSLCTTNGVAILAPNMPLKKGEYIYEKNPPVDFCFKWVSSNDEEFEETVRVTEQPELKSLLLMYGAASFRPVGSKGTSFMRIEEIQPGEKYELVHAGRRSHVLEVNQALDTLGKGEEDKTGEALLKVFGKGEGVLEAYLLPPMRRFTVEPYEVHHGEEGASQEWDAAAVIRRERQVELLLAEHKRRLKASDVRKMAAKMQRAIERSKDPQAWRAYSGLAAFDQVRAVCSSKYIAPSERKKVKEASKDCDIPILLENGSDLSIGSALLETEGD